MAPRRPSRPVSKQSVGRLLEATSCLETVDTMLLEGTPVMEVARWIQQDMGELKGVEINTLANALSVRRRQRQEMTGEQPEQAEDDPGGPEDPRDTLRKPADYPSLVVRRLRSNPEEGIRDLIELEALYLAQRDRIDRLMQLESHVGAFSEKTGKEIEIASAIIERRFKIKLGLGIGAGSGIGAPNTFRGYSTDVVNALSQPESRHRIVSLLERIARFGAHAGSMPGAPNVIDVEPDPAVALPMPKPTLPPGKDPV